MTTTTSPTHSNAPVPPTPGGNAFLSLRQIHKRFTGVHALRGVSLDIHPGQIYHLLGENGCGKSTLIKIISGAQPPDEGDLILDGERFEQFSALSALGAGIETVYQDLSLIPNLSVMDNISLTVELAEHQGRLARVISHQVLHDRAVGALRQLQLPDDRYFLQTKIEDLPLATRQLVAIARAVASDARFIIMDEPTTSLTQKEVDNLIRIVKNLCARGVAVLFVSHKLDECYAIGGNVIVMRDGQVITQGEINNFTKHQISELMTGRVLSDQRYRRNTPQAEVMLGVHNIGRDQGFDEVSFALHKGEIIGITGLLDSGRNELARALAGVAPLQRGSLTLNGKPIAVNTPAQAADHRIAYVPEDRLVEGLFLTRSISDNTITAVLPQMCDTLGQIQKDKAARFSQEMTNRLKIATPNVQNPVQSLSGGNQQRVLIGRWLAINPLLLILHGPTVGVDVGSKDTIYQIIQSLTDQGMSIIIISDDLPELLANCDRILLMKKGRISDEFRAEGLQENTLYHALLS